MGHSRLVLFFKMFIMESWSGLGCVQQVFIVIFYIYVFVVVCLNLYVIVVCIFIVMNL